MAQKRIRWKRFIALCLGVFLAGSGGFVELFANPQGIYNILHEEKEVQTITSGVIYEKNRRFTQDGWLDIHVMTIDMENPNVELGVLDSTQEFGLREPLKDLAQKKGAVAGINADFFNMSKNPADPMGLVVKNGRIQGVNNYANYNQNYNASFFVHQNGSPFIDFLRFYMKFYNGNDSHIDLHGFNRITHFTKPVYVDREIGLDTANIDKRYPGLYKIVVQDNTIVHISGKGEIVGIPENGYLIIMDEKTAQEKLSFYAVGQSALLDMSPSLDLSQIRTAISGGGKILHQGQVTTNPGYVVDPNKRHPRTLIGVSQDGKKVMFLAIDGRSHSIGLTHNELAAIAKQYGAYEAMHFDGGGSTTMVGRPLGKDQLQVFNTLSDGAQRKVVNGIGVFSLAPQGSLAGMQLKTDVPRVFQKTGVRFEISGYDQYYNPIPVSLDQVLWEVEGVEGHWNGAVFYPETSGQGKITAHIGNIKATTTITVMDTPVALEMSPRIIKIQPEQKLALSIVGLDKDGFQGKVNGQKIQWYVDPALGRVENNIFIAGSKEGHGPIEGQMGDTKVYGYTMIGDQKQLIDSFEETGKIRFISYPSYVKVGGTYTQEAVKTGKSAIQFHYGLEQKEAETQAAYVEWISPKAIEGQPIGLGLWVYGDGKGHWLRGRIKDQKGTTHTIDFADHIDWTGWKYVQASIPSAVQYPISLERIYITALQNDIPHASTLYMDDLYAVYPTQVSDLVIPDNTPFQDPFQQTLAEKMEEAGFDITVFGSTVGKNNLLDGIVQRKMLQQIGKNAAFSIFAGYTDPSGFSMSHPYYSWKDQYQVQSYQNVKVIQLATSKNGIRTTYADQWKWLKRDLEGTTEDHIIIVTNKDPLDPINGFKDSLEGKLFHKVLKEYKEKTGKNIFVINGSGYEWGSTLYEGIRYMDVNGLFYHTDASLGVDLHNQFAILRFRVEGKMITYDFQPLFKK